MEPYRFSKTIYSPIHERMLEILRAARVKAGLTQVQAAERLGCRQTFLSKIERGERRLDVIEFLVICRAYEVKPCTIMKVLQFHESFRRQSVADRKPR